MTLSLDTSAQSDLVRILHLEDSAIDAQLIDEYLRAAKLHHAIDRVWTSEAFIHALRDQSYDVILADHHLPNFDGHSALSIARILASSVPFIFVSGTLGEEVAVEALKQGATDYVLKQRLDRLPTVVQRALAEAAEREDRQRAEANLRDSEENFATLVNAMPLLCWMANADGFTTWYNQRWYDYTGTTASEMMGWGWTAAHDPALLPQVMERWESAIATGKPFEMTFPLRAADGRFRPFLTRAVPVKDAAGSVMRWLGTNTDISAQHEAEEGLRRLNETLEQRVVDAIAEREAMLDKLYDAQRLETIGQLTGGVAHDFNNLLTPIVGSLDILQQRLPGDDRSQRLITGALQAAERAKTLVQRLLAFARRQVLETRPIAVASLVRDMAELIARSLGDTITLEIQGADDLPAARVDPNQLELAILNLVVNARDAMPEGGSLRIAIDQRQARPGDQGGLRHGDYIVVCVTDTGIGMDAATLRRAIEPFFSTKDIGKGTGLGLSMVHGLAAQSGGALILNSQLSVGTSAEIWLPIANEQSARQAGGAQTSAVPFKPATILLVDDEALVRGATLEMLNDLGHHVIEAGSGAEALDLLGQGLRPDLVITDYLMPAMTGVELAREIGNRYPDLPILLATGYARLAGNALARLPLLPKPFRQLELAATIERLTRNMPET